MLFTMGRKKKGADLQTKIKQYMSDYELDDLNKSNDEATIRQLCKYELEIERLFDAISKIDAIDNAKSYKDLMSASRDATNAYNSLQVSLGIARKERASDADETPLSYIERLRSQAKQILDKKLKIITCPTCNLVLMKYHIYITEKGEYGAIKWEGKEIPKISYSISIECSNCGKVVGEDEREKTD